MSYAVQKVYIWDGLRYCVQLSARYEPAQSGYPGVLKLFMALKDAFR